MLLIFGFSVFFRTISEGTFHCPNCGGDRRYRRRAGRRWFTLFFLPVIPLGRLGEVVECGTCRTRFGVSVLRLPTAQEMAGSLPAGMRGAVAMVLLTGDPSDAAARRRAVDAVRGYGGADYDDRTLDADLRAPMPVLIDDIAAAGSHLTVEAKEWFLTQAARVALADGPLSDGERAALRAVADRLGMTPAHALGVIVTTEGAASS